jgi:hypothetical protein
MLVISHGDMFFACCRMLPSLVMVSLVVACSCSDVAQSSPELSDTNTVSTLLTKSNYTILEKLTVAQLINIFLASHGTRWFITMFTKAHNFSLS